MNFKKILKFAVNSNYRFLVLSGRGYMGDMPADKFLKKTYKINDSL